MTQKEISQLSKQINTFENRFDILGSQLNTLANRLDEFIVFSMEHVATKEDLKGFATKEDLKGFATKEDLFATKDDLRREMNIQKLNIIDRMDDKFADLKSDLKKGAYRLLTSGTAR